MINEAAKYLLRDIFKILCLPYGELLYGVKQMAVCRHETGLPRYGHNLSRSDYACEYVKITARRARAERNDCPL